MLFVPVAEGHVAVSQPAHGLMCAEIGRAWGNARVGAVTPREEVCLAAEQHDLGWSSWELAPTLDPQSGLPHTFVSAPLQARLAAQRAGPRLLAVQSRYAALLASLHFTTLFGTGPRIPVRPHERAIAAFLRDAAGFQRELRATLDASDAELERNLRLVRTWDGVSLNLLLGSVPSERADVPAADGLVTLTLARADNRYTLTPWPFEAEGLAVRAEGRLLDRRFEDLGAMQEALDDAPWVELVYDLVPTSSLEASSASRDS